MLLRLALRNVFRSRARSAITIGALFFGVAMSLILSGFMLGVGESMVEETLTTRLGALQVHRAGYFEQRDRQPLTFHLPQSAEFEARLRAVPNVAAVTPRIAFTGLLTNGSRGTIALATAVDPATVYGALPKLDLYLEGTPLAPGDANGAQVAQELSRALALEPGLPLMMQAQGLGGRDNALDLELRGTIGGQTPMESKRALTVPLAFAQALLGMQGKVTEYVVAVKDRAQLEATAAALQAALGPEYEVQTWEQLRPALRDSRLMQRAILGGVSFVFLLIALFGVANTLLMSVLERTREIGTLLAVGMTRAQVARLFVAEAAAQALLGAGLGLAVATLVIEGSRRSGGVVLSLGASGFLVMPTLLPQVVAGVVGAAFVGSILAALSPALRAARMRPVEALASS